MSDNRPRCLTPDCEGSSYTRGLCTRCHSHLRHRIATSGGKLNWEMFERMGICRPATRQRQYSRAYHYIEEKVQAALSQSSAPLQEQS